MPYEALGQRLGTWHNLLWVMAVEGSCSVFTTGVSTVQSQLRGQQECVNAVADTVDDIDFETT